jgi:hypothetical protein
MRKTWERVAALAASAATTVTVGVVPAIGGWGSQDSGVRPATVQAGNNWGFDESAIRPATVQAVATWGGEVLNGVQPGGAQRNCVIWEACPASPA